MTRFLFLVNGANDEDDDLREKRNYYFNRKGKLDSMSISYYFDDQVIGVKRFHWEGAADEMGYRRLLKQAKKDGFMDQEDSFIEFEALPKGTNS